MLEKANLFLVHVWDHRKEAVDSRYNEALFRRPTWDGGHFMNAVYLIEKYGVVPSCAMPETLGGTGILLDKKDPALMGQALHESLFNQELREKILAEQDERLKYFAYENVSSMFMQQLNEFREALK